MPSAKHRGRIAEIECMVSEWTLKEELDALILELHHMPKAVEIDDAISMLLDYRFLRQDQGTESERSV